MTTMWMNVFKYMEAPKSWCSSFCSPAGSSRETSVRHTLSDSAWISALRQEWHTVERDPSNLTCSGLWLTRRWGWGVFSLSGFIEIELNERGGKRPTAEGRCVRRWSIIPLAQQVNYQGVCWVNLWMWQLQKLPLIAPPSGMFSVEHVLIIPTRNAWGEGKTLPNLV